MPRSKRGGKTKVSSTSPASRLGTTAASPDDAMHPAPAAGHGGAVTPAPPSASSSPGINGEPAKNGNRPRRKNRSSSKGTPANENSAAAGASSSPSLGSSGSAGAPVEENSAARFTQPDAAAAAGSSAFSAAISCDPSPARSPKKAGKKGGVISASSTPVSGGTLPVTASTTSRIIQVEYKASVVSTSHPPSSSTHAAQGIVPLEKNPSPSKSTYLHGSGRQLKQGAHAASTSSVTVGDHAVSKNGRTEAVDGYTWLHKNLPHSADIELQKQFFIFLKEYTIQGQPHPFYKAEVHSLRLRKCYTLQVNFDHLKSIFFKNTTKYRKLVFKIVNNPDSTQSWLQRVIFNFLKSEDFGGDDKIIERNAKVHFTNKPQSIIMLNDALKDRQAVVRKLGVLGAEVTMYASTAYGKSTFLAVLSELLNKHWKRESYNGEFQIDNIAIVNSNLCWILMEPSPTKSIRTGMKSDFTKLWTIMEQYYKNEEDLPLYFNELQDDLMNEKLSNVAMPWFRLHLEYHPAFMPSMGRRHLIYGLNSVIQDHKSSMDEAFTEFLGKAPFDPKDWRDKVQKCQSQIMYTVYKFGPVGLRQDPLAKTGSSIDHFANTWEGLLLYTRHFIMHANNTVKIVDMDEIELLAARKFPTLLPRLLKKVLSNPKIQPYFAGVLSSYRTSRADPKDLPS